jgi:hypothetical protein
MNRATDNNIQQMSTKEPQVKVHSFYYYMEILNKTIKEDKLIKDKYAPNKDI